MSASDQDGTSDIPTSKPVDQRDGRASKGRRCYPHRGHVRRRIQKSRAYPPRLIHGFEKGGVPCRCLCAFSIGPTRARKRLKKLRSDTKPARLSLQNSAVGLSARM